MPAPFPMSCGISHTFSRLSHAILRPPTQAISPYVSAVPPYGHTLDASPHTFWQIPTGRPFSHTPRPIPHSQAISPYDPQASKIRLQIRRDQRSSLHKSPTNPVKQTSRTCVTPPQTNPQPVPANSTRHSLRKSRASQATQIIQTCDWGCRHLLHGYAHAHGQGHAFMRMGMAQANPTRPASGAADSQPILPNRCPEPA